MRVRRMGVPRKKLKGGPKIILFIILMVLYLLLILILLK